MNVNNIKNLKALVKFPCAYCNKPFESPKARQKHEKHHDPKYVERKEKRKCPKRVDIQVHVEASKEPLEKTFVCSYCPRKFKSSELMTRHQSGHFLRYTCVFCGMKFDNTSNKLMHERIHLNERPYGCSYCDKTFIQKSHMINHERLHTGHRPYKCSKCGRGFVQTTHRKHHEAKGMCVLMQGSTERPYKCIPCDKSYARLNHFIVHRKSTKCPESGIFIETTAIEMRKENLIASQKRAEARTDLDEEDSKPASEDGVADCNFVDLMDPSPESNAQETPFVDLTASDSAT